MTVVEFIIIKKIAAKKKVYFDGQNGNFSQLEQNRKQQNYESKRVSKAINYASKCIHWLDGLASESELS